MSLALWSCSGGVDTPDEQAVDMPITLGVGVVGESRADVEILPADIANIGLWTWKTNAGAPSWVMIHDADGTPFEARRANATQWRYDIISTQSGVSYAQDIKHWDAKASRYDFVAFYPLKEGAILDPATGDFKIPNIQGHISTDSPGYTRWMHAHTRRVITAPAATDYDMLASATEPVSAPTLRHSDIVPLTLRYVTPVVEIRAYATGGAEGEITSLTMDLSNHYGTVPFTIFTLGDYIAEASAEGYRWEYDETSTVSRLFELPAAVEVAGLEDDEIADRRSRSTLLASLSELPQDVSGYYAHVQLHTASGADLEGIVPLQQGWQPNTRYIYYIVISNDTEYIVMDVDVEVTPWLKGDDIVPDAPLENF